MKITAQNLNGITGPVSVDLTENTYLTGPNGSGKTTLCKIPYYILTGKGLDVKNGFTQAFAEMEFQGYKITRTSINGESTLYFNGNKITTPALTKELEEDGLLIKFFTEIFQPNVEFSNDTIIKMANISINNETIKKLCDFKDDTPEAEILNEYFKENEIQNIDDINSAYKLFYSTRTSEKKELAVYENKLYGIIGEFNQETLDKAKKELSELPNKKAELMNQIETIQKEAGKISTLIERKATLEKEILELKTKIEDVKEDADKLKLLKDEFTTKEKNVNDIQTEINKKNSEYQLAKSTESQQTFIKKINEYTALSSSLTTKIKMLNEQIESFEKGGICPLASGFVCPVGSSEVIPMLKTNIEKFKEELNKCEREKEDVSQKFDNYTNKVKEIERELNELNSRLSNAQYLFNDAKRNIEKLRASSNVDNISLYKKMIEEKEKEMSEIKIENIEEMKAILQSKKENYKSLNDREVTLNRNIVEMENVKSWTEELKTKKAIVSGYSTLIKTFKALPTIIFSKITQPLQQAGDAVLSVLKPEWQIKFVSDKKGIIINICSKDNGEVSRENLSTGEKVILDYLLKNIGCQLTGFDTILIDNVDALDNVNTENLVKCINKSSYKTLCVSSNPPKDENLLKVFKVIDWYK